MKKLAVLVYILMIGLPGTVAMAATASKLPYLIPVVVNAYQGAVEIQNIGDTVATPSQIFVVCSRLTAKSEHAESCAAGLQLSGFIVKWNTLPIDIPTLQPGEKYLVHIFGAGAFPRRPGTYGMKITADPLKHIAESSEKNNYTRLDTVIKVKKLPDAYVSGTLRNRAQAASEGEGFLHLRVLINGRPIPFEIGWTSPARGFLSEEYLFSSDTGKAVVPLTGTYVQPMKLRVGVKVHERAVGGKDIVIKRIAIRKGEKVEKTVDIHQPGVLNIMARWTGQPLNILACAEYHNPVNLARLGALMRGGSGAGGRSRGDCLDPKVSLAATISSPGRSDGNVARMDGLISKVNKNPDGKIAVGENIEYIDIEAGVYDIGLWPVGHRELEQTLKGVEITSGGITERKLEFRWPGKKK